MNDKELEVMKIAMLHEDEGAEYYLLQSKQWHDAVICENFKALSDEEKLHSQWIKELFLSKKEFGDEKMMTFMKGVKGPGLFDWSSVKRISDLDKKAVFKKAMDLEEASYKYYEKIKEESSDPEVIRLLEILIDWEISHYKTFKTIYDGMA